jgi:hypothetical protein
VEHELRAVMISCRQRRETERPKTLASLARVGVRPRVFESPCDPPHPRENRRISLEALSSVRGHDVLFLEDDVDADETLPAWLDLARSQPHPVTFCVVRPAFHPPLIRKALELRVPIPTGLLPIANVGTAWYGTQAIYLPASLVEFIVSHPAFLEQNLHRGELTWTGFDLFLREYLPASEWRLLGAFPNPVEHRDPPKLVARRLPLSPRKSLTYCRPAAGPVPSRADESRVDARATAPHYLDHVRPVFDALPNEIRGTFYTNAARLPISERPTIVSAFGDLSRARRACRPVILMEHGAGMTYRDSGGRLLGHTSYAGGRDRSGVILYLSPGPNATRAHLESGVPIPVVEIGSPKLDAWHSGARAPRLEDPPILGFSFHWDSDVAPETRSAWARYLPAFAELRDDVRLLAHAHPRLEKSVRPFYDKAGFEIAASFDEILERASVYACDNSSTMYEFASTGRPVIVLNHRIYRRSVHHGLRFWEGIELGPIVDRADELRRAVARAFRPSAAADERRRESVAIAYHAADGRATERAVRAILDAVG